MAKLIWTEPAVEDLEAIGKYIARDKPDAARQLVQRVVAHTEQLREHPESGSRPREVRDNRYRQLVEPPCRILYRFDGERVFVLHVLRGEMTLRLSTLRQRDREN